MFVLFLFSQPFADGLVTVIVPHLGRGENSLNLWNNSKQNAPICSFIGHSDVVLDFAWRPNRNQSSSDMELITWSRDQSVRVWKVDEALQKQCESPLPDDDGMFNFESVVDLMSREHKKTSFQHSIRLVDRICHQNHREIVRNHRAHCSTNSHYSTPTFRTSTSKYWIRSNETLHLGLRSMAWWLCCK